jgi:hypothetical protein
MKMFANGSYRVVGIQPVVGQRSVLTSATTYYGCMALARIGKKDRVLDSSFNAQDFSRDMHLFFF